MCASRVWRDVAQLFQLLLSTNRNEETVLEALCVMVQARVHVITVHFLLVFNHPFKQPLMMPSRPIRMDKLS